jgi:ribose/xylose/arabinose/galactoside ABC-type transport system permease subunit
MIFAFLLALLLWLIFYGVVGLFVRLTHLTIVLVTLGLVVVAMGVTYLMTLGAAEEPAPPLDKKQIDVKYNRWKGRWE